MRQRQGHRRSRLERRWAPPVVDGGWSLRLRFGCIALAFACCSWFGLRAVSGRVSFAWLAAIQQQAQGLIPSSDHLSRAAAVPTMGSSRSPLVQPPTRVNAQAVPTPVGAPTVPARAVIVLVPTATAGATRAPAVQPTLTARPRETASPTASALAAATAAADLAAGPHTIYVVRAGDTLYGIARRYGLSANVLADFNHLTPPYKIIQGHRLLIPAV